MNRKKRIEISLLTQSDILKISKGEVLNGNTLNYRTNKPEFKGLFCPKIFGSQKEYSCFCEKYVGKRFRGIKCDVCEVDVESAENKRKRMGHIYLNHPVVNTKALNLTIIRFLTGQTSLTLKNITNYQSAIEIESDGTYRATNSPSGEKEVLWGAEAIEYLLKNINLDESLKKIEKILKKKHFQDEKMFLLAQDIKEMKKNEVTFDGIVMKYILVLPTSLRPTLIMGGGKFISSDVNQLYRRVIYRNDRVREMKLHKAPLVLLHNERKWLQKAVDQLIWDGYTMGTKSFKSVVSSLKGKEGRFRQNLLGKRVDFSARSVISLNPNLKIDEVGIPFSFACELFSIDIQAYLLKRGIASTLIEAREIVRERKIDIEVLKEIIRDRMIILNRQPTLFYLGLQGFYPIITWNKTLEVHPLICPAMGADFDGDAENIHVSLSEKANEELKDKFLYKNSISTVNGGLVLLPTKEILLTLYLLTKDFDIKEDPIYMNLEDVDFMKDSNNLKLNKRIFLEIEDETIETTFGRAFVYLQWIKVMREKEDGKIILKTELKKGKIDKAFNLIVLPENYSLFKIGEWCDTLKSISNFFSTKHSVTVGMVDFECDYESFIKSMEEKLNSLNKEREEGMVSDFGYKNEKSRIIEESETSIKENFEKSKSKIQENVQDIITSGASGNILNVQQLDYWIGVSKYGEAVNLPITTSLNRGLGEMECFAINCRARENMVQKVLGTAVSGYFNRKLVELMINVKIETEDCGNEEYISISTRDDKFEEESLGRFLQKEIILKDGTKIKEGTLINHKILNQLKLSENNVCLRKLIHCKLEKGVCAKCYGWDVETGEKVNVHYAAGIRAAQSLSEPGTQMSLQAKHIRSQGDRIENIFGVESVLSGTVKLKESSFVKKSNGEIVNIDTKPNFIEIFNEDGNFHTEKIPYGASLKVENNSFVEKNQVIYTFKLNFFEKLAKQNGRIKFINFFQSNGKKNYDDAKIHLLNELEEIVDIFYITEDVAVLVEDSQHVLAGDPIISKEEVKNHFIGGTARLSKIFSLKPEEDEGRLSMYKGKCKVTREGVVVVGEGGKTQSIIVTEKERVNVYTNQEVEEGDVLYIGKDFASKDIFYNFGRGAFVKDIINKTTEVMNNEQIYVCPIHIEMIACHLLDTMFYFKDGEYGIKKWNLIKEENYDFIIPIFRTIVSPYPIDENNFLSVCSYSDSVRNLKRFALKESFDDLLNIKSVLVTGINMDREEINNQNEQKIDLE